MKAYLANGLFGEADRMYNSYIADELQKEFSSLKLYVPQNNLALNDKSSYADSLTISNGDDSHLLYSDFLIAIIDGVAIDEGVSCEIGKYQGYHLGRKEAYEDCGYGYEVPPIFALFTDVRQQGRDNHKKIEALKAEAVENQFPYRNLYVIGTIKQTDGTISPNVEELIESIRNYINKEW